MDYVLDAYILCCVVKSGLDIGPVTHEHNLCNENQLMMVSVFMKQVIEAPATFMKMSCVQLSRVQHLLTPTCHIFIGF